MQICKRFFFLQKFHYEIDHHVGNGVAYKIPAFLANTSFSNLSEVAESTQSEVIEEASDKVSSDCEIQGTVPRFLSSDCEIKGTVPRFLCNSSSLITPSTASQDEIAFISSTKRFSPNALKDAPTQGNVCYQLIFQNYNKLFRTTILI